MSLRLVLYTVRQTTPDNAPTRINSRSSNRPRTMLSLRSYPQFLPRPNVLATVAAVVLFIAIVALWVRIFHAPPPAGVARPALPTSIDTAAGATLFGAQGDRGQHDAVQLLGILAFDAHHAAAVISVGGDPAHVVPINGTVTDATTLTEVRAHSIIVERNGLQREITMPAPQNPSVFMR
ncbi:general secretion pathway protein GspC [Paraburkholderia sp.]|uniref:general secretion pathway protein GspC n=1 Tax=Paraburkholderia sp. TaxID=1926495 RepID=UPI0026284BF0|nr:general secretion pathway protein GspC [Paraburkholderia sp.]